MKNATARILLVAAIMLGSMAMVAAPASAHGAGQRERYTNGCTIVPDVTPWLNFRDACNAHDVCYARYDDGHHQYGTDKDGRKVCDDRFLGAMWANCGTQPWGWRPLCYTAGRDYYLGVRSLGADFYYDYNTLY